jgi:hypothetical protein
MRTRSCYCNMRMWGSAIGRSRSHSGRRRSGGVRSCSLCPRARRQFCASKVSLHESPAHKDTSLFLWSASKAHAAHSGNHSNHLTS